ncbi:MAG: sigma 54-interacting transcriptional regulator [Myxococcales bacterium]|nr:sigma 54-interacting transcriptional regulator [Myxococcales bacterium]
MAKTHIDSTPPAPPKRLRLFVASEGGFTTHQLPESGEVTVGRDPSCGVVVDDKSVAPRHAILSLGPPVRVEDMGSGLATSVGEERVGAGHAVELAPGDIVHFGGVIAMVEGRGTAPPRRIFPHGYFELRLEEECNRAARYHSTFAMLRIACDPACPPAVIEEVVASAVRLVDIVAADGPGDYEVLLLDTPPDDVRLVVSRLEEQLGERAAKPRISVAHYPRDGRSADALFARATGEPALRTPHEPVPPPGPMQDLYRMVERIASSDISVIIFGETGVGKERLAEAVHKNSRRVGLPFLRLNCAALTETLLESELFGHEKGAFTGAAAAKAGLLESANGGSVFLDEVGDMPMPTQVKLLRVIEERAVRRVGAIKTTPIDVRFVAATNRDLELEVQRGAFRKDLYFRLNGVSIFVPPLRERVEEIEGLSRLLITEACKRMARAKEPELTAETLAFLQQYPWPGNIRELRNVLERAVLLCTGNKLELSHLPAEKMASHFAMRRLEPTQALTPPPPVPTPIPMSISTPPPPLLRSPLAPADLREQLAQAERQRIVEALNRCAGNQTEAALSLGISRRTLVKRLATFNIPRPRKRQGSEP